MLDIKKKKFQSPHPTHKASFIFYLKIMESHLAPWFQVSTVAFGAGRSYELSSRQLRRRPGVGASPSQQGGLTVRSRPSQSLLLPLIGFSSRVHGALCSCGHRNVVFLRIAIRSLKL